MRVFARTSVRLSAISSAALLLCSLSAKAGVIPISVVNGSFEQTAYSGSNKLNTVNAAGTGLQQVTGWTSSNYNSTTPGYNFVFTPGTADTTGAYLGTPGYYLKLYGLNDGGTTAITASPDGGNFIAMDGAYQQSALSQTLTGLTVGMDTKVSFYYAGAQQSGYTGVTTEAFQVSLGSQTVTTATLTNASTGFTGWQYVTLDFMPTSTTETLSFLALGTPSGEPPISLLDGVSVVQVTPEPSSLALLGTGVLAVGGLLRRRRAAATL